MVQVAEFDDRVRAERARQILDDPVFVDAVLSVKRALTNELIGMDAAEPRASERAIVGILKLQALEQLIGSLQSTLFTGEAERDRA